MRAHLLILFGLGSVITLAHAESGDRHLDLSLRRALHHAITVDRDDIRHPFLKNTVTALVSVNRWLDGGAGDARIQAQIDRIFAEALIDLGPLESVEWARVARFLSTLTRETNSPRFARRAFALANARQLRGRKDLLCEACLHAGAFSLTVDLTVGLSALVCHCLTPKLALSLGIGNLVVAYLTWTAQAEERAALRLNEVPNLVGPSLRSCATQLRALSEPSDDAPADAKKPGVITRASQGMAGKKRTYSMPSF